MQSYARLATLCYIDVTGLLVTDRAQSLGQVERLTSSHTLHGSESLCKLLRYLAKHALEHPGSCVAPSQAGNPPCLLSFPSDWKAADWDLDQTIFVILRISCVEPRGSLKPLDTVTRGKARPCSHMRALLPSVTSM